MQCYVWTLRGLGISLSLEVTLTKMILFMHMNNLLQANQMSLTSALPVCARLIFRVTLPHLLSQGSVPFQQSNAKLVRKRRTSCKHNCTCLMNLRIWRQMWLIMFWSLSILFSTLFMEREWIWLHQCDQVQHLGKHLQEFPRCGASESTSSSVPICNNSEGTSRSMIKYCTLESNSKQCAYYVQHFR